MREFSDDDRIATEGSRNTLLRHKVPISPNQLMSRARKVRLNKPSQPPSPCGPARVPDERERSHNLQKRSSVHFVFSGGFIVSGATGKTASRLLKNPVALSF